MITIVNQETGLPMNIDIDLLLKRIKDYEHLEYLCRKRYDCDIHELVCCAQKFTTIDGEYTELESETEELEDNTNEDTKD